MELQLDNVVVSAAPADGWIERVLPGVTLEWVHDRQMALLRLTSISFEAVDAWVDTILQLLAHQSDDHPYLVVYDLSDPQVTLTPYVRARTQEVARAFPEIKGRVAVLSPRGGAGRLLKLFVNQVMRIDRGRQMQVFFTRENAVAWLAELLPTPPIPA